MGNREGGRCRGFSDYAAKVTSEDEVNAEGVEDVPAEDWDAAVYGPDIYEKGATIFKQPGYPAPEGMS